MIILSPFTIIITAKIITKIHSGPSEDLDHKMDHLGEIMKPLSV